MSTPVATIGDALISFILSLLRDPAAVEEFSAAPKAMMASNGLQDACKADVQAVKPVIVDHPSVEPKPVASGSGSAPPPPPSYHHDEPDEVVREISRIINQFTTIDARSTIVDQSVNQNIWTNGGDVTQLFDQEAVVASGDEAIAAGEDATLVDSDVDVTVGDVSIGNTTNDGSFNTTGEGNDEAPMVVADPALAAEAAVDPSAAGAVAGAAVAEAVDTAVDTATTAAAEVSAPAEDPLAADLTSADSYESDDSSSVALDDPYVEEPAEDQ